MTDQQIRLYALARTMLPPDLSIRSFREDRPEIFPRIGIRAEETGFVFVLDERLSGFASDAMILYEIEEALRLTAPTPTHVVSVEVRDDECTWIRNVCSCGWEGKWREGPIFVRVDPYTGHDVEEALS